MPTTDHPRRFTGAPAQSGAPTATHLDRQYLKAIRLEPRALGHEPGECPPAVANRLVAAQQATIDAMASRISANLDKFSVAIALSGAGFRAREINLNLEAAMAVAAA